jgi:cbb3-type cytochrome oxidase maturation protein
MSALLILVPVSLLLVGVGIAAFGWALRGGQFDDLDAPGLAPLVEDAERELDGR